MSKTLNYFLHVFAIVAAVLFQHETVEALSKESPRRAVELRHHRRLLWLGEKEAEKEPNSSPDLWFTQLLDHFDPLNSKTWQQRYMVNVTFFNPLLKDSPVFLMVGGEGPISSRWMGLGTWQEYAAKYGALCFQLEHRFYGKSHPMEDMSTEGLKFLSSEQALADIAYFIEGMINKHKLSHTNKWVLFGGSYPGSLVGWARSKYPHLVHAAIASSAPLVALADFQAYNQVVKQALRSFSCDCSSSVHQAALHAEKLTSDPTGGKILSQLFQLCEPLDISNRKEVSTFAEALAGNFDEVVQYNGDNRIGSTNPLKIDDLCDLMIDSNLGSPLERYAQVNHKVLALNNQTCLDVSYKNMVNDLKNVTYSDSDASGGRQWTYQTCTEFGFFQTSSTQKELFGSLFNVDYFIDTCTDVFGPDFDEQRLVSSITRTNILYGGLDFGANRVMFVHGSIDPWHALGITEPVLPRIPAVFINGTAHCADMYPPSIKDSSELRAARLKIMDQIGKWLMKP